MASASLPSADANGVSSSSPPVQIRGGRHPVRVVTAGRAASFRARSTRSSCGPKGRWNRSAAPPAGPRTNTAQFMAW